MNCCSRIMIWDLLAPRHFLKQMSDWAKFLAILEGVSLHRCSSRNGGKASNHSMNNPKQRNPLGLNLDRGKKHVKKYDNRTCNRYGITGIRYVPVLRPNILLTSTKHFSREKASMWRHMPLKILWLWPMLRSTLL